MEAEFEKEAMDLRSAHSWLNLLREIFKIKSNILVQNDLDRVN